MRKPAISIAAGVLAGATLAAAPAIAAPANSLGAISAAADTLGNVVEPAAVVCDRWRCWHSWEPGYWGPEYWGPRYGEGGRGSRRVWGHPNRRRF